MMDVLNELTNGTISTWFISPLLDMSTTISGSFYTRTLMTGRPDRMYVRYSTAGWSSNVGNTPDSIGDFTNQLLAINPSLSVIGYPNTWTKYTFSIPARGAGITGRIAFHYYVTNAGPLTANGYMIGIDTLNINANKVCDTTSTASTSNYCLFIMFINM